MGTLYKRNRYWWISLATSDKKRLRISTRTTDKKLAKTILASYEGKIAAAHLLQATRLGEFKNTSDNSNDSLSDHNWIMNRWASFNARERLSILFSYYKGRCYYCNVEVRIPERRKKYSDPDRGVIDHRIPHVAGGSDSFDNLVLACSECNKKKTDRTHDDFMREMVSKSIEQTARNAR